MNKPPKWKAVLIELRAPFLTGSLVPVFVGTAFAFYKTQTLDIILMLWTFLAMILLHLGANTANDYFDHLSGNDAANISFVRPFTGGSRTIQQGWLSPREVITIALIFLASGSAIGLYIVYLTGLPILLLGIIGTFTAFFYTAPPVKLVYRGLGEPAIGICFGILPVMGSYYVQTGHFSKEVFLVSLPVALLITNILYVNQFQDFEADRIANKRNWVVTLGTTASAYIYSIMLSIWILPIIAGLLIFNWPKSLLFALLSLLPAAHAAATVLQHHNKPDQMTPANGITIVMHLATGIIMGLCFFLA